MHRVGSGRVKRVSLVLLAVVVAAAVVGASRRDADAALPRVFERTVVCSIATSGGVYEVKALAYAGVRDGGRWLRLPFASIAAEGIRNQQSFLDNSLSWISAAAPAADTNLVDPAHSGLPTPARTFGTLALNKRDCAPSKTKVPLSGAGLRDVAPGPLGESFDCPAQRRVLVHVRAVATAPPVLYGDRQFTKTRTAVEQASVAVQTLAGKPLVFASTSQNGRTRLLVASSCAPD